MLWWVLGSPRATSVGVSSRRARRETRHVQKVRVRKGTEVHRGTPMAAAADSGSREGKAGRAFIGKCALVKGSRESSHGGPRHGAKTVQAASQWRLVGSAASQWPKAVRPPGVCECSAWRRPGPKSTTHRSPLAPRTDQGSPVWLGVHVRRGTAAGRPAVHDVARAQGAGAFQC
jgi:hypothetical protein